jgi:ATP-dependent DNA helicase RecQ
VLDPEAQHLFDRLRAVRLALAQEQGVPPYVVFHDATLALIAEQRPTTRDALLAVPGVGRTKLERYGDAFLAAVREA